MIGGPRVDRYAILRDGAEVGTVPGTETSFLAQGLSPNTAFRFAVVALAGDKRSDPSAEAAVTTLPAVPANVRAAAPDPVSGLVQWDPGAGGIDRYVILRDGAEVGSAAASETSVAIQGLRPGAAYRFVVVAVSGERRSDPSNEVSVTTSVPSPEDLAADPAATTTDSIVFAWSPPPNSPAPDAYVITRNGQTIAKVAETS